MGDGLTIGMIAQGSLHRYWKSLNAGAMKAERDLMEHGILAKVQCEAPLREDDRDEQARIVQRFVRQGAQGIVLAPFDKRTLVKPVEEAANAGIPTVVVDSALDTPKIVSFIATDNKKGGALAADRMGQLLGVEGGVLILRYQQGSASTEEREEGFAERLRRTYPQIQVICSDEYAGATRDTARAVSERLLIRHGKDLYGVFTPNESSTAGMLMALRSVTLPRKVVMIGFDSSDVYLDSMRYAKIQGLVVQNPFRMGELAVKTLVDHIQGKPVSKRVDIPATMVTPDNIDAPEIQRLLNPLAARVGIG